MENFNKEVELINKMQGVWHWKNIKLGIHDLNLSGCNAMEIDGKQLKRTIECKFHWLSKLLIVEFPLNDKNEQYQVKLEGDNLIFSKLEHSSLISNTNDIKWRRQG
jgi:hypothetical protein